LKSLWKVPKEIAEWVTEQVKDELVNKEKFREAKLEDIGYFLACLWLISERLAEWVIENTKEELKNKIIKVEALEKRIFQYYAGSLKEASK